MATVAATRDPDSGPLVAYIRVSCLAVLVLIACTWRLWLPESPFPQVPFLAVFLPRRPQVELALLAVVLSGLTVALVGAARPRWSAGGLILAAVGLVGLCLANQHRFQPWVYQFLLVVPLLIHRDSGLAHRWLRMLFVCIYFFSAVSKLDLSFLSTTGSVFVATLLRGLPINLSPAMLTVAALILPSGELWVAARLFCDVRSGGSRGARDAILLHGCLLFILGPWGLNHRPGVLVWNLACMAQLFCLMRFDGSVSPTARASRAGLTWPRAWRGRCAVAPFIVAAIMPCFEPWEFWDAWPSWGLYSARNSRAELYLTDAAAAALPVELQRFCRRTTEPLPGRHVRLDLASLEQLQTPLYPSARFQWGVCLAIIEALPASEQDAFVVEYRSVASRFDGRQRRQRFTHLAELRARDQDFWLNSRPRAIEPRATQQRSWRDSRVPRATVAVR